jgi:hypothetical protein
MKTVVAATILAASITAPATAHADPWFSTPPQNRAFVTGLNHCHAAARRLRDFGTPIPLECANSGWNAIVNPPPPGDAPPPADPSSPQP